MDLIALLLITLLKLQVCINQRQSFLEDNVSKCHKLDASASSFMLEMCVLALHNAHIRHPNKSQLTDLMSSFTVCDTNISLIISLDVMNDFITAPGMS